jgi:hypothetical protein
MDLTLGRVSLRRMISMNTIFLDTSIHIARFFQGPDIKEKIDTRIKEYSKCVSSLVVKHEFKRRVLKEALYLLTTFERFQSYQKVRRWIEDNLPAQQGRKRNICLNLLSTIGEIDGENETDIEISERAVVYLRALLKYGISTFENSIDEIITDSQCACAKQVIIYRKDEPSFGLEKCSKISTECGVLAFLTSSTELMLSIKQEIESLEVSTRSEELKRILQFIVVATEDPASIRKFDPCLTVGDLLIAIESKNIKTFYTLNEKESRTICKSLKQRLIIRPRNYTKEDIVVDPI